MFKKLIPILLILSLLVVGCGGGKAFGPLKTDSDYNSSEDVSGDNSSNNPDDNNGEDGDNSGNTGDNGNNGDGDNNSGSGGGDNNGGSTGGGNTDGGDNNNGSGNNGGGTTNPPATKTVTIRWDGRDMDVQVNDSSYSLQNFPANNKALSDLYLKRFSRGWAGITDRTGKTKYYFGTNGDIHIPGERPVRNVKAKYIGPVLVKVADPDKKNIHGKLTVGGLYQVIRPDVWQKDGEYQIGGVWYKGEPNEPTQMGGREVLIFNKDKGDGQIYVDAYRVYGDSSFFVDHDLFNPQNFYSESITRQGKHKRVRWLPQNWFDWIYKDFVSK